MLSFAGPGYLVAVGYMDPGNWATDLAGGSAFGYTLLSVIMLSNIMAIILQYLSIKLGIVSGRDLAQACRDHYSRSTTIFLWILAEIAIIACDLAEVIGSAIALYLLFHIPLAVGVIITAGNVALIFMLQHYNFRYVESLVIMLITIIMICFITIIIMAQPSLTQLLKGFIPTTELFTNTEMLYIAVGILGATVMPHNLYLHSAIVQTRNNEETEKGKREALWFFTLDSTIALSLAFFVNAAILIVAAAVFHVNSMYHVAQLGDAYLLLSPLLGTGAASIIFALALLLSGQNATLTGTLAGQIIMEGFIDIKIPPWARRLISRSLAIIPAMIVIVLFGEQKLSQLLLLSQVILSLQLPFAVFPLVRFTSQKDKMHNFVNSLLMQIIAYGIAFLIALLNIWLIYKAII